MKLKLFKSFGEVELEAADDKDIFKQATLWSSLPEVCPLCGANYSLKYRETTTGGFKYYELVCAGQPGQAPHRNQLGQYKTGGLFYKAADWEVNQWRDETPDAQHTSNPPNRAEPANGSKAPKSSNPEVQKALDAFAAVGVLPPPQKPNEPNAAYLERLRSTYREKNA